MRRAVPALAAAAQKSAWRAPRGDALAAAKHLRGDALLAGDLLRGDAPPAFGRLCGTASRWTSTVAADARETGWLRNNTAAVLAGVGDLRFKSWALPATPPHGHVRIAMQAVGICGALTEPVALALLSSWPEP
jgi:hypothetical protein